LQSSVCWRCLGRGAAGSLLEAYATLGISPREASRCTVEDLKVRYRELAKSHHPDTALKSPPLEITPDMTRQRMENINDAYQVLVKDGGHAEFMRQRKESPAASGVKSADLFAEIRNRQQEEAANPAPIEAPHQAWLRFLRRRMDDSGTRLGTDPLGTSNPSISGNAKMFILLLVTFYVLLYGARRESAWDREKLRRVRREEAAQKEERALCEMFQLELEVSYAAAAVIMAAALAAKSEEK